MTFKDHFINELQIFKKQWYIIPFFALCSYFHNCSTNLAYYNDIQRPVLHDSLFELLPENDNLSFINEYITNFILLISFLFSFLPLLKPNKKIYILTIWFRMMITLSFSVILRSLSFLSTSLPGSSHHCRIGSTEYNPPTNLKEIFLRFDTMSGCGDLIFSGHTNIIVIQIILIFYYGNKFLSSKIMFIVYFIMTSLLIIIITLILIARNHYTVDVLIALYVTPLLFHFLFYQFPDYIIKENIINLNDIENRF
tara:strand:+ start:6939 stop:7697 length:759 start_codon:yes stop_codon:yes gene_type:complete